MRVIGRALRGYTSLPVNGSASRACRAPSEVLLLIRSGRLQYVHPCLNQVCVDRDAAIARQSSGGIRNAPAIARVPQADVALGKMGLYRFVRSGIAEKPLHWSSQFLPWWMLVRRPETDATCNQSNTSPKGLRSVCARRIRSARVWGGLMRSVRWPQKPVNDARGNAKGDVDHGCNCHPEGVQPTKQCAPFSQRHEQPVAGDDDAKSKQQAL